MMKLCDYIKNKNVFNKTPKTKSESVFMLFYLKTKKKFSKILFLYISVVAGKPVRVMERFLGVGQYYTSMRSFLWGKWWTFQALTPLPNGSLE